MQISGAFTALVTPFRDGQVDCAALVRLVELQVEAGVAGVVPCGTTGESPTLSENEHQRVIAAVVKAVRGRGRVIAGAGSNCTAHTIELSKRAADVGADGLLLVAPYYNKPSQEGLYRHYAEVARQVNLPIVLYNVPGRCGVHIENETVVRLRNEFPNIAAIKHASGCLDSASALISASDIAVLSGDDSLTWPLMAVGAVGVISVIGNLVPRRLCELVHAAAHGPVETARNLHRLTFPLSKMMLSLAPNPIPVKTALSMKGLVEEEFRLPLCPMSADQKEKLRNLLKTSELL